MPTQKHVMTDHNWARIGPISWHWSYSDMVQSRGGPLLHGLFIRCIESLTQETHGVIITTVSHQNDVTTSFWRVNGVIITLWRHFDVMLTLWLRHVLGRLLLCVPSGINATRQEIDGKPPGALTTREVVRQPPLLGVRHSGHSNGNGGRNKAVRAKNGHNADSRFAPSRWETVLLCNAVSHWLGANLEF